MSSTLSDASDDRLAVSPAEACRLLSIGRTHLYELLDADHLKSIKIGRSRRILMRSIRDFVGDGENENAA